MNEVANRSQSMVTKRRALLIMALASLASLMIVGCLLAKYFVLNAAISSGVGTPASAVSGVLFSGLAFSAPIQSAFVLAFFPCSWFRRVAIASVWMIVVVLAFAFGNQAHPFHVHQPYLAAVLYVFCRSLPLAGSYRLAC